MHSRNEAFYLIYNYQRKNRNFKKKCRKKTDKTIEHRKLPIKKRTSMKLRKKNPQ